MTALAAALDLLRLLLCTAAGGTAGLCFGAASLALVGSRRSGGALLGIVLIGCFVGLWLGATA